jgi:hypothetical protein
MRSFRGPMNHSIQKPLFWTYRQWYGSECELAKDLPTVPDSINPAFS